MGVLGLALERLLRSAGGLIGPVSPGWLEPAIESALLLGMLGTLSGMVSGFAGLRAEDLEPAPLLHALGRLLALTGEDDANILACLFAKSEGARETIAVVHRLELLPLLPRVGVDIALSPRTASANAPQSHALRRRHAHCDRHRVRPPSSARSYPR